MGVNLFRKELGNRLGRGGGRGTADGIDHRPKVCDDAEGGFAGAGPQFPVVGIDGGHLLVCAAEFLFQGIEGVAGLHGTIGSGIVGPSQFGVGVIPLLVLFVSLGSRNEIEAVRIGILVRGLRGADGQMGAGLDGKAVIHDDGQDARQHLLHGVEPVFVFESFAKLEIAAANFLTHFEAMIGIQGAVNIFGVEIIPVGARGNVGGLSVEEYGIGAQRQGHLQDTPGTEGSGR